MKITIYEDPITRTFALIRVPPRFAGGDKLPIPLTVAQQERAACISAEGTVAVHANAKYC
jgi:hypothetical protein